MTLWHPRALAPGERVRSRPAAIVESADGAIFGALLEGGILMWNALAVRIVGSHAVGMIGTPRGLALVYAKNPAP